MAAEIEDESPHGAVVSSQYLQHNIRGGGQLRPRNSEETRKVRVPLTRGLTVIPRFGWHFELMLSTNTPVFPSRLGGSGFQFNLDASLSLHAQTTSSKPTCFNAHPFK